ncbi:MAG: hypothetical protein JWR43_496 [Phenylobacterium sp.]|nr:hypothetical protein [Phenylobacterium sp.]
MAKVLGIGGVFFKAADPQAATGTPVSSGSNSTSGAGRSGRTRP